MILLIFVVLAPLLSFRLRRIAAGCGGIIGEIFSSLPFGIMIGIFFLTAFFLEVLEERVMMKESAGWAITAFSVMVLTLVVKSATMLIFEDVSFLSLAALLTSNLIVGLLLIAFLWMPVKLSMKQ